MSDKLVTLRNTLLLIWTAVMFYTIGLSRQKRKFMREYEREILAAHLSDGGVLENKYGIKQQRKQNSEQHSDSEDCSLHFGNKGDYNLIPLLSLPGSGNTWARFLLEQATGVYTVSSIYKHIFCNL